MVDSGTAAIAVAIINAGASIGIKIYDKTANKVARTARKKQIKAEEINPENIGHFLSEVQKRNRRIKLIKTCRYCGYEWKSRKLEVEYKQDPKCPKCNGTQIDYAL